MGTVRSIPFLRAGKQAALIFIVCFPLFLSGCSSHPRTDKDAIVADLGNQPITIQDLETTALFMGLGGKSDQPPDQWSPAMRELILRETVQDILLVRSARKRRITVSPGERQAFDAQHFPPSSDHPEQFTQKRILLEKTEDALSPKKPISSSAIQRFYRQHLELFLIPETAVVDHIVVAREDEARTLHDALVKGASFSKMARLESLGTEASEGGRMKPFSPGALPPPFDAVFSMKPDEVSDVLSSPYGYHLFRLVQIRPEHRISLSDARNWIVKQLRHRQTTAFLRKWMAQKLQEQPVRIREKYRGIFSSQFGYNGLVHSPKTGDTHDGKTQDTK